MKMKKNILLVAAVMMSLTCFAQFPGGGGFPGGGMPPMGGGGFGGGMPMGGFGGFGGPQGGAQVECSEKFTDINYAGDDGQVYHMLDIYLPKEVKDKYPVVVRMDLGGCGRRDSQASA